MAGVLRSPESKVDLADIATYIGNDSPGAALRWLDGVDRLLKLLAANPRLGEAVDTLRPGMRRHTYGRYLVFYMPADDGIVLYRVLHGSRRIEDLF
jgi:toxin ParE1/3/4